MPDPTPYDNPPETSATACSGRPKGYLGDRIFCDNISIEKKTTAKDDILAQKNIVAEMNITAKNELQGASLVLKKPSSKVVVRETTETGEVVSEVEYVEAIIVSPGPLSGTIVTFPDKGLTTPILPQMRLLIALPPA